MNKIAYLLSIIVFAALAVLTGCGDSGEKVSLEDTPGKHVDEGVVPSAKAQDMPETTSADATPQETLRTVTVREIASLTVYSGVGSFKADDDLNISSKVGGTLIALRYDKGDTIYTGKTVAEIDPENFELALESAEAQVEVAAASLELAQNEFERKKEMLADGAIPPAAFDAVSTQLDLAVAQKKAAEIAVKQAEKLLRDAVTESPVSGVVTYRHVSSGEFVGAGDPLITVSVLNPLKLVFSVPERLATRIAPGEEIDVRVAAFPGKVFTGKITLVGPLVDQTTRSVPIEARFDNSAGDLKPGFFAEVQAPLVGAQRQFSVPASALVQTDEGYSVSVAESGQTIPVSVISKDKRDAVVTGDLSDGLVVNVAQ